MNSVFRKGDVVYHKMQRKAEVSSVDPQGAFLVSTTGSHYYGYNDDLSFSPWPKPNHERPFTEVGWWMGTYSGEYVIRWRVTKTSHRIKKDGYVHESSSSLRWIKFLGTEL